MLAPTCYIQPAGAKAQQVPATSNISISSNVFSVLDDAQGDPSSIRGKFNLPHTNLVTEIYISKNQT